MKVHVVDYSPAWNKLFREEAERVSQAFGASLTAMHHIGSTAVPRLAAKPVIDMMPVVRSLKEADEKRAMLETLGYEWCGELGIPGRRYLRKDDPRDPETRLFQLHVFDEKSTADIRRHLAVRDYLRAHGDAASEYGALKRKIARKHPADIEAYCDGKGAFVNALEAEAVAWWNKRAENLSVVPVRERPGIAARAAVWFSSKWDVPADEYRTSMEACCAADEGDAVPQWYVVLDGSKIVAGAGVIDNDFHTHPDLTPNVCAVYVEPEWRGLGIARALLDFVCRDMSDLDVARLFLLTDHEGLYERMGWRFHEIVRDNDGAAGRMYKKETKTMAACQTAKSAPEQSPKPLDDATRIVENRLNWDDRAEVHADSEFYEVEQLVSDPAKISGTARRDYDVLRPHLPEGGLAGKSVLHLQCHIGTDTLSWVRLGAREVWGLDFSPVSLAHARRIAQRAGAEIAYVQGDVRYAADFIDHSFDVVVTGTGAICWLPNLEDWARSIARLLVTGGVFLLRDDHPLLDALAYEGMTVTEDYLSGTGCIDYEDDGSYTDNSEGLIAHSANHNWRHDFQEILGSLLDAGLAIEGFHEFPYAEWRALPFLEMTDGVWTMPKGMPQIPLSFAAVARKPKLLP